LSGSVFKNGTFFKISVFFDNSMGHGIGDGEAGRDEDHHPALQNPAANVMKHLIPGVVVKKQDQTSQEQISRTNQVIPFKKREALRVIMRSSP